MRSIDTLVRKYTPSGVKNDWFLEGAKNRIYLTVQRHLTFQLLLNLTLNLTSVQSPLKVRYVHVH
jgi:hypothetical protein